MFAVGDRVEVKWQDGNFFAANVTTVHNDGFLGVEYDEVSLPPPIYFFIPTVSLVFRHTNVGTRVRAAYACLYSNHIRPHARTPTRLPPCSPVAPHKSRRAAGHERGR